jgi:hypothetical protein
VSRTAFWMRTTKMFRAHSSSSMAKVLRGSLARGLPIPTLLFGLQIRSDEELSSARPMASLCLLIGLNLNSAHGGSNDGAKGLSIVNRTKVIATRASAATISFGAKKRSPCSVPGVDGFLRPLEPVHSDAENAGRTESSVFAGGKWQRIGRCR